MLNELYYRNVNNIVFNDINSKDLGLLVSSTQSPYGSPKPVVETVNIPGRGNLILNRKADPKDNDEYEDIKKRYSVHVIPDPVAEQNTEMLARAIYRWLYQHGTTYRRLEDSYEPGYYRQAYVAEMMSVERIAQGLMSRLDIDFTCKAYKYRTSGSTPVTIMGTAGGGMIYNPEGFTAYPLITVYGAGDISLFINERNYDFTIPDEDDFIRIDSEKMNSYRTNSALKNSNTRFKYYPKLEAGENIITWNGSVTKIDIVPRWCTL